MNFLNRLWPRRRAQQSTVTMAVQLVELSRPIPLSERQPGPDDFDSNHCWWGAWLGDHWRWIWDDTPVADETHWLPATAQLLPARCCPPEVES